MIETRWCWENTHFSFFITFSFGEKSFRYNVPLFWRRFLKPCQTACSDFLNGIYKNALEAATYLQLCQQTYKPWWKTSNESGQNLISSFTVSKAWTCRGTYCRNLSWISTLNPPCTHVMCMLEHIHPTVPQGQEDGLAGDHGEQVNMRSGGRQGRRKSQKKPREVFESSGIPLLLRGSSGRRQEPVERAR